MVSTPTEQVLLVARRDPQDPVRRVLKEAGLPFAVVDSPAAVVRTAERVRPTVIVLEAGAVSAALADAVADFAEANQIALIRDWPTVDALVAELQQVLGKPGNAGREGRRIVAGALVLDLTGHEAVVEGSRLDLTAREFELACHLARHPGWVFSRQELLEQVWGYEFGDPRVVTVHMANLRKKLEAACPGRELIETVRGVGYKLAASAAQEEDRPRPSEGTEEFASASGASSSVQAADERRLVTVVAGYIGGLALLADSVELGSLKELADELFGRFAPCIEGYDGRLERRGLDGFVAFFGAPLAHDDDAGRGLAAAADLRQEVARFKLEHGVREPSIHVGISTGTVIAGSTGDQTDDYSVVGVPLDVAFSLASAAGDDQILVDSETIALAGGIADWEEAGSITVRGQADGRASHRVTAVVPGRQPQRGRGMRSELVGRDEQLALFRGALRRLQEGEGVIVFVTGDAGVGKSRLHQEIRHEALQVGLRWIEARTLSYGQHISYLPFRTIVQADCGIEESDPADVRGAKLHERLGVLFADKAADFFATLGGLLGVGEGALEGCDSFLADEEATQKMLFEMVGRYVRRVATERALVLVFEDVHWLDRSSTALITSLFSFVSDAPIGICLVGRAAVGSPTSDLLDAARQRYPSESVEIRLSRLSQRHTQQLVRNLLGDKAVEASIVRLIESRSEGNPFFVEEMVWHLRETGSLRTDEQGKWNLSDTAELALPSTVQGVIAARIDRLPERTRNHLLQASVIGRSFYRRLLRGLSTVTDEEFDADMISLLDLQFIDVKRQEPELEYMFSHALVQEAAYGTLLAKQRKALHLKVAKAIEQLYSAQVKDLYGILAYHYTKAEDWRSAQVYLLKGGSQSVSLAADAESVSQYEEAMAALLRAFDESWDSSESSDQVRWFVAATEPFWLARCLGDLLGSALVFYQKILGACGPGDPRTIAASTVLAGCYYQRGLYDQAIALLDEALQAVERSGAGDASTTRLLLLHGMCSLNTLEFGKAEEVLERAYIAEGQKSDPDQGLMQDLHICLASAYIYAGRRDDARRILREALHKFDLQGTQRYWMVLLNLSHTDLLEGSWDEARAYAQQCLDGCPNRYMRAFAANQFAEIRLAEGAYLDAEEHLRYAAAVFEELGEPTRRLEVLADLAETQLRAGKLDRAERTARDALALVEATSSNVSHAEALWTLAGVALARSDYGEADSLLAASADVVQAKYSQREPFRAELSFRLAELRAKQGLTQEGQAEFERAVSLLAEVTSPRHPRLAQMRERWADIVPVE